MKPESKTHDERYGAIQAIIGFLVMIVAMMGFAALVHWAFDSSTTAEEARTDSQKGREQLEERRARQEAAEMDLFNSELERTTSRGRNYMFLFLHFKRNIEGLKALGFSLKTPPEMRCVGSYDYGGSVEDCYLIEW